MATSKMVALSTLALCAALVGCNDNKQTPSAIADDHDSVAKQLDDQNSRLDELGAQLQRERSRAESLASQLEKCQDESGEVPPPATASADVSQFAGIPGVEASAVGDDIHLVISNNLLFDSGKTSLKDSSKKSLDQVASKIKELHPTRQLEVVGHTDADPIRKSAYSSNYHLGFERAFKVREYLGKKGLPEQQMALVSYGPDHPKGSKDRSRRVEIIVTGSDAVVASKSEQPRNASSAASKASAPKTSAPKSAPATKTAAAKNPTAPSK